MTFRAAVAAGLLAAVSLGCTEAPKSRTTATKQARVVTPPKRLGSYTMTVTPLPDSGGRRASVVVVPDAQDGNPNTNPGGSVQVAGRFNAVITPAGGQGCAGQSLGLPLTVTNFAAEALTNVQVQITSMSKTGFEVCKAGGGAVGTGLGDPALLPAPANSAPGALLGLVPYGTLTGAVNGATPVNNGSFPGQPKTLTWWFKFPSNTPVSFTFVVWADPQQPVTAAVGPEVAPGTAFTWTSAGSATSRLELCTVDPTLTKDACPANKLAVTAGVLAAGTFSATPTLVDGTNYWWRAVNTFSGVAGNFGSGWEGFTAVAPATAAAPTLVAPLGTSFTADVLATATPILLQWNTAATITDTVYQICTGPCPLPFGIDPLDPNLPNLVYEDVVAWAPPAPPTTTTGYEVDVAPFLPTDPLTGDAWLATGTYTWTVSNYDFNTGAIIGPSSSSSFIIAPGAPVAVDITAPVALDQFPANSLATNTPIVATWTTDPAIAEAELVICDNPTCAPVFTNPAPPALPVQTAVGAISAPVTLFGFAPTAGAPYEYAQDLLLLLPTDPNAGDAWLLPGRYYLSVDSMVGGVALGAPTVVAFDVVSSMPALPVITGPLAPAPANAFANLVPVNLAYTAPAGIAETEVHVCGAVLCTSQVNPVTGVLDALMVPMAPVAIGSQDYAYDVAFTPDVPLDVVTNAYMEVGTYNWSAYNVDPVSLVTLYPGANSTFTITAVPYGVGAFTAAFANTTIGVTPITAAWTGPADVPAITYELYDSLGGIADTNILVDDGTLVGSGKSHFVSANLTPFLAPGVYTWKVIDDGLYQTLFGFPPAGLWTTGTVTIQ